MNIPATITSLNPHLVVQEVLRERDILKVKCTWEPSGDLLHWTSFSSEPNFFDLECRFELFLASDEGELALRRYLDLVTQDVPYVRAHLERYRQDALVRLSLAHELPVDTLDRSNVASKCVTALVDAARQVESYVGRAA